MTFAPTCPFCSVELPADDPDGDRHACAPRKAETPAESPILAAALRYAEQGIHVFPVRVQIVDGRKKVTPIASWRDASTVHAPTIRYWFGPTGQWAGASLAIDTGKSGLVVVDPDGPEGMANWLAMVEECGIAATYRAATPRPDGGQHWYYRENRHRLVTIDSDGKVAPHVDIRGAGGFVIAAPSTDDRGVYRWLEGEPDWQNLPVVPDVVADRMAPKPEPSQPTTGHTGGTGGPRRFTRKQAAAFVQPFLDRLRTAPVGSINDRLNVAAKTFSHFVPTFWSVEQVYAMLKDALIPTEYDGKTWKAADTIDSGLTGKPGDWMAELIEERPAGPRPPLSVSEAEGAEPEAEPVPTLDDAFWESRGYLKHIRDAAHSRQRSAPAVLGVVLTRVAALVDHRLRIPAIVGSDAGLSLITAILAPPGVGKSTASAIGSQIVPVPDGLDVADQLPIGTGEGMAEAYFGMVPDEDDDPTASHKGKGKPAMVKAQVRHNAYFFVDEGQVLGEIGNRRGATLLPTIRSAFTGSTLGQANASVERRRILPSGSYTMGVVVALQTTLAGALLDDAEGGTPQRLLWLSAIDPTIPEDGPPWPGRIPLHLPGPDELRRLRGDDWAIGGNAYLEVAESIQREIRAADLGRARGEVVTEALDAHEGMVRLKIAALLAILDGRVNVTEDDWQLATLIKAASDATRSEVEEAVRRESAKRESEHSSTLARRAVHADVAVAQRKVIDGARWIARKVHADPTRWTVSTLRRSSDSRNRDVFTDALDHAVAEGWVVVQSESGQGADKRVVRPGKTRTQ